MQASADRPRSKLLFFRTGLPSLCGAFLLLGCSSAVSGRADPNNTAAGSPGSIDPAGAGSTGLGSAGSGTVTTQSCAGSVDPGPAFVRRLTRMEYDKTASDLLGITSTAAAQFPTEEVQLGFNDIASALSVSPELAEQYLNAAETLAKAAVANNLSKLAPCGAGASMDVCEQQFIAAFGQRAFRRPLAADEVTLLSSVFDAGKATDFQTGVTLVIETVLQSPRSLYRIEYGRAPTASDPSVTVTGTGSSDTTPVVRLDDWEMASRLSYLIWGTMPDDELFAAAAAGRLTSPTDIQAQARRMLSDMKAHAKVADFHSQWLGLGTLPTLEKDSGIFPEFNATIASAMQKETLLFMDEVIWNQNGTLDSLFTAPFTFLNGALAQYYGIAGVNGDSFVKTSLDPTQRAGLLTQGGILSKQAKLNQTSPVLRGKFVREQLFCQPLPPPPANVSIKVPELSSTLTTRQRFTEHSVDPACSVCHRLMDPVGLSFESFDGAGKYRATENGQPVDVSGQVNGTDATLDGPFSGVVELEHKLGASSTVQQCVTKQWFRYAYGRGETSADTCSLATINTQFAAGGFKIQDLLAALTQTDAFLYRRVTPAMGAGGTP